MKLDGVRALVLGTGLSGRSAAAFLMGRGARVVLADDAEEVGEAAKELDQRGAGLVTGGLEKAGTEFDLAILSPGISANDSRIVALIEAGVETIGEVELASRFITAPIIAVTGTNGKTTVTELIGEMLEAAGKKVFVGGNVGTPLIEAVAGEYEVVVAEISSFQLELAPTFRPCTAVWLNLTGDHLDRHGDMTGYGEAKAALFANQLEVDYAIINRDDPLVWSHARDFKSCVLPFSLDGALGVGGWREGEDAVVLMPGTDGVRMELEPMSLAGDFNIANALAATLAAATVGAPIRQAWDTAREFQGLAHRNEEFLRWQGVTFVDDSKATNVDAALKALEACTGQVIWLAGGKDKGADYSPLLPALKGRVKLMISVGAAARRMREELAGATKMETATDWPEAVKMAVKGASEGDTVLLSPAAASFDFFRSYAERGETFKKLCRHETARIDDEDRR